jgi:hypothetical protein
VHCNRGNLQLGTRTSRIERFVPTNLSEHAIDPLLVFHKSLVRLVFIHGVFAYHDVHSFFYLNHEGVSALVLTKLNPEFRERHLSSCPVDVEIDDFNGSPTAGNRPDPGSNELFNDVAATKYNTGKMKFTLAI